MKLVASSGAASHAGPRSFFLHVMAWQRLKPPSLVLDTYYTKKSLVQYPKLFIITFSKKLGFKTFSKQN